MLIDNINITVFGAELLDKKIGTAEFIVTHEWLKKAYKPLTLNKENKYTPIECNFVLKATTRQELEEKASHFLKKIEECTIKFDDIEFYYDCILQTKGNEYIGIDVIDNLYIESIDAMFLSGHKYKSQVTEPMNRLLTKTINVPGNAETPAIVEITPSVDAIDLTIVGLDDDPIIIKNLKQNKKIIINGEDGTVLQDGINKFTDTDMWDFPSLKPGSNTIALSKNTVDINIKYKGRWI